MIILISYLWSIQQKMISKALFHLNSLSKSGKFFMSQTNIMHKRQRQVNLAHKIKERLNPIFVKVDDISIGSNSCSKIIIQVVKCIILPSNHNYLKENRQFSNIKWLQLAFSQSLKIFLDITQRQRLVKQNRKKSCLLKIKRSKCNNNSEMIDPQFKQYCLLYKLLNSLRYILIYKTMQIINAFIFNFIIVFIILTALLSVFAIPMARRLLFKFRTNFRSLVTNQYIGYVINISFAVIGLLLLESLYTFNSLNSHLENHRHNPNEIRFEKLDLIKAGNTESYLEVLKEYREYYLAERNIMLTCSALFVYYVFHRLLLNINKLTDLQNGFDSLKQNNDEAEQKNSPVKEEEGKQKVQ